MTLILMALAFYGGFLTGAYYVGSARTRRSDFDRHKWDDADLTSPHMRRWGR
jgi:hypothetical protein